jgi:hypothetical protein
MSERTLNWQLRKGSHDFPGPDGGTCINEAAIVAAGFKYRAVRCVHHCPKCFSPPVAQYARTLNDMMPDDDRQRLLLPFVLRFAGTACSVEVERKRARHIIVETTRQILSEACERYSGHTGTAERYRAVQNIYDVKRLLNTLKAHSWAGKVPLLGVYRGYFKTPYEHMSWAVVGQPTTAAEECGLLAAMLARGKMLARENPDKAFRQRIFESAVAILDGTIKIGLHRTVRIATATRRMEEAKRYGKVVADA